MKLKASKCWQSRDGIIWQIQRPKESDQTLDQKKGFLCLSMESAARSKELPLTLVLTKPESLLPNGALITILRKYAASATLVNLQFNPTSGETLLTLWSKNQEYLIYCDDAKPPFLHFIDVERGLDLIRFNDKRVYTKPYQFDSEPLKSRFADFNRPWPKLKAMTAVAPNADQPAPSSGKHQISSHQRQLKGSLKRRLRTLRQSYSKIEAKTLQHQTFQKWREYAEALQSHPERFEPGSDSVIIEPFLIPLNPLKSYGQNIDELFARYKKEKSSLYHLDSQIANLQHAIKQVDSYLHLCDQDVIDQGSCERIRKDLKLRSQQKRPSTKPSPENKPNLFKSYKSGDNLTICVGRGSLDNDLLTKSAKANDYWFHATNATGSHVLVPANQCPRGELPALTKAQALILALHFSGFRNDKSGECYFARKADLKKKKGMAPGLWLVQKAETIYKRYSDDELKAILDGLI